MDAERVIRATFGIFGLKRSPAVTSCAVLIRVGLLGRSCRVGRKRKPGFATDVTPAGQKGVGPTGLTPNLSARAGRSASSLLAIRRSISSTPPGKVTTAMRSGEFERLPHA